MSKFRAITGALVSSLIVGCVKPPPPPPAPQYLIHHVAFSGETVGAIAKWYTGDLRNYTKILEANPGLDARRMSLGTAVQIPAELLVREDPLPKKAISVTTPKQEKPAPKPKTPVSAVTQEVVRPTPTPTPTLAPVAVSTPKSNIKEWLENDPEPGAKAPVVVKTPEAPPVAVKPEVIKAPEKAVEKAAPANDKKSLLEEMLDGQ